MSDLARVGDLLSLHGSGVLEVSAIGGSYWLRSSRAARLLAPLEHLCWEREPIVNALPLRYPGRYLEHVDSSLLWIRTESGKSASKLRTFKPKPSVVIREGGTVRYVAFWALSDPLGYDYLDRANRRLAHHLGCPKKYAAQSFQFYLPGTILRSGRGRPLPVELVHYEPAVHTARDVVGRLREAPDPDAWRKAQEVEWTRS